MFFFITRTTGKRDEVAWWRRVAVIRVLALLIKRDCKVKVRLMNQYFNYGTS